MKIDVAPLVGARIEISPSTIVQVKVSSLPSWERGLKLSRKVVKMNEYESLPSWERGLKSSQVPKQRQ